MSDTVLGRLARAEQAVDDNMKRIDQTALTLLGDDRYNITGLVGRVAEVERRIDEIEGRTRATANEIDREFFKLRVVMAGLAFCTAVTMIAIMFIVLFYP